MPGGDGSTLLRDIRRDLELKSRQVVIMTGRPDLVTPRQGMEEGADDFLLKPINLRALLSCVKARFDRASVSWRVGDQMLAQLRSLVPSQLPHEFFTPLNGIIGLTELLCEGVLAFTPAELSENAQSRLPIRASTPSHAPKLSPDSRPPERFISVCAVAPLAPLSGGTHSNRCNDALRQYKQRGKDVRLRLDTCSFSIQLGDLSLIVEELVDNAFKFSRHETPVSVELSAGGRLIITDRGRCMSAEEIRRVGALQQFDHQKYEQQGLGLGLVLVQKLVARCHGEFSLSSAPGERTQAQIDFPLAETGSKKTCSTASA
jgi:two-component system sensor histidine kinase/response regulator